MSNSDISFSKRPEGGYTVKLPLSGLVLGTVVKNAFDVWQTTHSDGTPGPGAWSRIDAAWALINS